MTKYICLICIDTALTRIFTWVTEIWLRGGEVGGGDERLLRRRKRTSRWRWRLSTESQKRPCQLPHSGVAKISKAGLAADDMSALLSYAIWEFAFFSRHLWRCVLNLWLLHDCEMNAKLSQDFIIKPNLEIYNPVHLTSSSFLWQILDSWDQLKDSTTLHVSDVTCNMASPVPCFKSTKHILTSQQRPSNMKSSFWYLAFPTPETMS